MERVIIPQNLKGKELYKFLVANKSAIIASKKCLKWSTPTAVSPSVYLLKEGAAQKAVGEIPADATTVRVKIVGNTCNWVDNSRDVLIPGCWNKTLSENKSLIYHLHDHVHMVGTDAEVGDIVDVYAQPLQLAELGLLGMGSTECLIMDSDVKKDYNPRVFSKYINGKIKQHSVGMLYIKIGLAINDPDCLAEYELWNKYYPQIINKDVVDECGYFFPCTEARLFEISCVLFGDNEVTPTLEVSTDSQPGKSTEIQPKNRVFDFKALKDMVTCPDCGTEFDYEDQPESAAGCVDCPNCGTQVDQTGCKPKSNHFKTILNALKD